MNNDAKRTKIDECEDECASNDDGAVIDSSHRFKDSFVYRNLYIVES